MPITKEGADKLISRFNEIFEEMPTVFEKTFVNTRWYILEEGAICIEFDSPIKEGLMAMYYKNRPSLWTRIKEAF